MAITNTEFTTFGIGAHTPSTAEQISKQNTELNTSLKEVKFDAPGGKASVVASKEQIMISNKGNGIIVNDIGTVVDGLFHIGRQPSDVRISTFWTFNNELLTTLPSTTYTPIPVLVYTEPSDVKFLASLMQFMTTLT